MNEQWQELKETITEMRDNDGTGTQQEVCKFLVNYMGVLEKQMQEPCGDLISRQAVLDWCGDINMDVYTNEVKEFVIQLPSVKQESKKKTGHWIKQSHGFKCSKCLIVHSRTSIYCPSCGAKMVEQERSDKE